MDTTYPVSEITTKGFLRGTKRRAQNPAQAPLPVPTPKPRAPPATPKGIPQFQLPSAQETFSLDIGMTKDRLGRDDQAQSFTSIGGVFGSFNHLLDDRNLSAHRALRQIVRVLVDPDQRHRPVNLQDSVQHISHIGVEQLAARQ